MSGNQFFLSPNELMTARYGNQISADAHRNALLTEQVNQQTIGTHDTEMAARIAQGLVNLNDEAKAAELYPGFIREAQGRGFLKNAPLVWPGMERARAVAALGVSAEKQYERQGVATELAGIRSGLTGAAPGGGGAAVAPAPPGTYGQGGKGSSITVPPEYMPFYQEASQRTGIPVEVLIAQHRQESGFNPNATGAAGEIGIGQIHPNTARDPGYGMTGVDPARLRDPRTNINFAADYLKARGGGGNWADPEQQRRALAAYNGGGDPNYVANVTRYLPAGYGGAATQTATAAPGAPAGGGGQPAPYQVATVGPTPPPPTQAAPVAPSGAPMRETYVRGPDGSVQKALVPTDGSGPPVPVPPAAPAIQPAATTQQPAAPPPAPRPAEMPPELRTVKGGPADGLTKSDVQEFSTRPATTVAQIQQLRNDMEQRRQHNERRQDKWVTDQRQAEQDAAVGRREQRQIEATERQIAATEARLKQDAIEGNLKTDKQQFDKENTLRDEFGAQTAGFRVVQGAYENIRSSSKVGDGASDMSMLYSYLKLLDPNTGIKEGEFGTAASSGSLGDKLKGAVNSIITGGRLSEDLRQNFVREAKNLYDNARKGHDITADQYETLAKRYGLDPERVVTRFTRPQDDAPAVVVKSDADYNALPSGTIFTDPKGQQRRKP